MIDWMEENRHLMSRKQGLWHRRMKEEVFSGSEYVKITVKRIGEKVTNMRRAYRQAKELQNQSGFGLRKPTIRLS
jgi:adenine C2-methylase RlmN of 23S rRNA A2503 and tRNA A37